MIARTFHALPIYGMQLTLNRITETVTGSKYPHRFTLSRAARGVRAASTHRDDDKKARRASRMINGPRPARSCVQLRASSEHGAAITGWSHRIN
jgi:hypothetical protein